METKRKIMTDLKNILENLVALYKKEGEDNDNLKGCYPVVVGTIDTVTMSISGRNPIYDGLELNYYGYDKTFEVAEFQAGKNEDEIRVYTRTKSMKIAVKSLLKGNKGRRTIEKW